VRDITKL